MIKYFINQQKAVYDAWMECLINLDKLFVELGKSLENCLSSTVNFWTLFLFNLISSLFYCMILSIRCCGYVNKYTTNMPTFGIQLNYVSLLQEGNT